MTTQVFAQTGFRATTGSAFDQLSARFLAGQSSVHLPTSSADEPIDSLPMELTSLGLHADNCKRSQGPMFALRCAADAVHGFVAPRVITTLVVSGFLIGISSLIL